MQKSFFLLSITCCLFAATLHAQEAKKWSLEAGPYFGVAAWTFDVSHSSGIGADARLFTNLSSNFSAGARVTYAYFFGTNKNGLNGKGSNLAGIYGNLQYAYEEKFIAGADLGIGLSNNTFSKIGFARTGYLGYRWKLQNNLLTLAAYLNRTTFATYNIGIKSWWRF